MKKLILAVCVLAFAMTSCSSDDDSSSPQDQIIGTWKFFQYFEDGVDVGLDPCEDEETLVFSSNGDLTITYFVDNAGTCELDETVTGTWSNEGNGSYETILNGFTSTDQVTFTGNTFYLDDIDDNGTPADTSDDIVYREVYVRQ